MRKMITLFAIVSSLTSFAQTTIPVKNSKFSVGFEAGKITSYFNTPSSMLYGIICCFGDCSYYDNATNTLNRPMPVALPQLATHVYYQLSKRHQIGLGFHNAQYGESKFKEEQVKETLKFYGFSMKHRYALLKGKKISLSLSNSLNLDVPKKNDFYFEIKKGISHVGGIVWAYQLRRFDVEASIVGRTAISGYYDFAWTGIHHRFGYGAMLGLSYKI